MSLVRTMKERRSFLGCTTCHETLPPLPVPYMQIVSAHCVPLHPSPLFPTTKRSRSNFHPVRNFYFSSNARTKGGQSLASARGGKMGRRGMGSERHSPFLGRSTTSGSGTVSFLRQSIQLPRNRHRRWEEDDGKRQEGRNLSLFPSLHPFPSPNFSTSPLFRAGFELCFPATRARNNERGGKKEKNEGKRKARGSGREGEYEKLTLEDSRVKKRREEGRV